MMKFLNVRGWRAGVDLRMASDGHWDWTLRRGDRVVQIFGAQILRRDGEPPMFIFVAGPFAVSLIAGRR